MREASLAPPSRGEALVRSRFGAISRGTEALVAAGEVPEAERARMRAPFQEGDFPFPVKYGYSVAGHVEDGPEDWVGRAVFCLHPHQDRFTVPLEALRVIPADVPPARAVLAANMETALNIVWDAGIQPGDRIAIVGAGVVGLLTGYLAAAIPGTEVTLVDVDPARAACASLIGVPFAPPARAPADCDTVIHASGSPAGLSTALACAGFEARVVEASWYGDRDVPAPLGRSFHSQRLTLLSSQVGHVPPGRRARWSHSRRLDLALALLADARLDALISGETGFSDLPDAYLGILRDRQTLCHRIAYT
ncbi:zinc-binding alcohol dehydrogenase [Fulvimarina sp. 2208YS6-2-32]|uniref:Zinc-binding alcohol dehydrogenase n=1 Tax=Fulvimarina uroteuthidis TaxID=3098149 RepID=A0ABU5I335_9HYPH|nr:zinc-binding alcohol dehydrogenase [Fulvimarina sp. 2208YS6-2-32]MDY8109383.1 zinc-binding alcohol dehydrogenase [Fulvimarina sp. 2208YS6-2-32]